MQMGTAAAGTELLTQLRDESPLCFFDLRPVKCDVWSYTGETL